MKMIMYPHCLRASTIN